MPEEARLLDLVVRWEESREAGQTFPLKNFAEIVPSCCRRCESAFRTSAP